MKSIFSCPEFDIRQPDSKEELSQLAADTEWLSSSMTKHRLESAKYTPEDFLLLFKDGNIYVASKYETEMVSDPLSELAHDGVFETFDLEQRLCLDTSKSLYEPILANHLAHEDLSDAHLAMRKLIFSLDGRMIHEAAQASQEEYFEALKSGTYKLDDYLKAHELTDAVEVVKGFKSNDPEKADDFLWAVVQGDPDKILDWKNGVKKLVNDHPELVDVAIQVKPKLATHMAKDWVDFERMKTAVSLNGSVVTELILNDKADAGTYEVPFRHLIHPNNSMSRGIGRFDDGQQQELIELAIKTDGFVLDNLPKELIKDREKLEALALEQNPSTFTLIQNPSMGQLLTAFKGFVDRHQLYNDTEKALALLDIEDKRFRSVMELALDSDSLKDAKLAQIENIYFSSDYFPGVMPDPHKVDDYEKKNNTKTKFSGLASLTISDDRDFLIRAMQVYVKNNPDLTDQDVVSALNQIKDTRLQEVLFSHFKDGSLVDRDPFRIELDYRNTKWQTTPLPQFVSPQKEETIGVLAYEVEGNQAVNVTNHQLPKDGFDQALIDLSIEEPGKMFLSQETLAPITFDSTVRMKGNQGGEYPTDQAALTYPKLLATLSTFRANERYVSHNEPFTRHLASKKGQAIDLLHLHGIELDKTEGSLLNMAVLLPNEEEFARIRDVLADVQSTQSEFQKTLLDVYSRHSTSPLTSMEDLISQPHLKASVSQFLGPDVLEAVSSMYQEPSQSNDHLERSR